MPRVTPQRALARRAAPEELLNQPKWLQHGIAVLAVSVLGLGLAGSSALTGAAQGTLEVAARPAAHVSVQPGVAVPKAFDRRASAISRSSKRSDLTTSTLASLTARRKSELALSGQVVSRSAQEQARQARAQALKAQAVSTKKAAKTLKARRSAAAAAIRNTASLPVVNGYRIAARFGDVGFWARYHTGLDFSAPIGTPVHAAARGVVTTAGSGPAGGWAGTYVTVRHEDGTTSLYAHLSNTSVTAGQSVSGGELIGAVGMTGRTFGPHVHFEIYPAGAKPGDVYKAVDPAPWLHARGLKF